ncbi:MAG: TolC family protein [Halieaceae bacterium]|nr:TolC family protein [Halieaceae bacterium]
MTLFSEYLRQMAVPAVCLIGLPALVAAQTPLTLERAVSFARENDPWLEGSRYREQAAVAQSVAAGTLPDPEVTLGFANLPVDSFDFGQEQMTQFRVGVSQMFPRGETRELKRRELSEQGAQYPLMRSDRLAKVTVAVSQQWLEAFRNRQAVRLIEKDSALFGHLVDVAESSYTTAAGKTRQQDLIRAQLELTRLEDRLLVLQQQRESSLAKLAEWLPGFAAGGIVLSDTLPVLALNTPYLLSSTTGDTGQLLQVLLTHPRIKTLDQKIIATGTGVQLAKQKYKPQWEINAGYGYRDDDPMGDDRSDFFSLGVSFDVPLFTFNRQDREVHAAQAGEAAIKTEKVLALRSMRAGFEAAQARLERLNQRRALYEKRLLQEIHDQAEASLTAYTNDAGDFSEVVRARIAELNANIDFLNINIDRLKTIAELNYFLTSVEADSTGGISP